VIFCGFSKVRARRQKARRTPRNRRLVCRSCTFAIIRRRLILGGLVLALLVSAGALRLDEATHGYYSGRLFVLAVGFLTLIGSGIWWLM